MNTEQYMSTPVVFTQPNVKINYLKEMFTRKQINAVPVMKENGEITGIITSSDIVSIHDETLCVADVMSSKVHVCAKNSRIQDAGKIMLKHNIHHLIVMEDGNVIGMLSSMDIIKALITE